LRDELLEKHKTAAASTEVPVGMEVALCSGRREEQVSNSDARAAHVHNDTRQLCRLRTF
jgi:hypothetical protein